MESRQALTEKLIQLVAKRFSVDPQQLSGKTDLTQDIDADSIDFVELLLQMEDEFDTAISDETAEHLKTIDDIVDFVIEHGK
ncbi:acyl carrier protein [Weissella uvarum]|uniref:acyl carrier protein n=1 Tax=Weissella uvarum TaxID=1479233 RepID=UPI0019617009|nr:acyl carrier protein [Weissella uvarum]MBM7617756.1 acyl carrier protein [Weissella uvarum]MCM0595865.1 acyl carrier protein [Weissella uvarum]